MSPIRLSLTAFLAATCTIGSAQGLAPAQGFLANNDSYVHLDCPRLGARSMAPNRIEAYHQVILGLGLTTKGKGNAAARTLTGFQLPTPQSANNRDDVGALLLAGYAYSGYDLSSLHAQADPSYAGSAFHKNASRYLTAAYAPFDHGDHNDDGDGDDSRLAKRLNAVARALEQAPTILGKDRWANRDVRLFALSAFYLDPVGLRFSALQLCNAKRSDYDVLAKYGEWAVRTTAAEFPQ